MSFKIFAIHVNGNHVVIPLKNESPLGDTFNTREDAEKAFNDADKLQISSLRDRPYSKKDVNCTILEIL